MARRPYIANLGFLSEAVALAWFGYIAGYKDIMRDRSSALHVRSSAFCVADDSYVRANRTLKHQSVVFSLYCSAEIEVLQQQTLLPQTENQAYPDS